MLPKISAGISHTLDILPRRHAILRPEGAVKVRVIAEAAVPQASLGATPPARSCLAISSRFCRMYRCTVVPTWASNLRSRWYLLMKKVSARASRGQRFAVMFVDIGKHRIDHLVGRTVRPGLGADLGRSLVQLNKQRSQAAFRQQVVAVPRPARAARSGFPCAGAVRPKPPPAAAADWCGRARSNQSSGSGWCAGWTDAPGSCVRSRAHNRS